MNATEIIQLNKFSHLHDGKNIIFCKTDFLLEEFDYIQSLTNQVVLITGNSDHSITEYFTSRMPSNIKVWYAQNCLANRPNIHPLPIGIENKLFCERSSHGYGYTDRVTLKEKFLSRDMKVKPAKFIYANFNVSTNPSYRQKVKNFCLQSKHIDFEDPVLSLEQFFNKILEYKMVLCPIGNGIDTHRLWETLYSNRIPITIKAGDFKIYKMYEEFPIVILDDLQQLEDKDLIESKYKEQLSKQNYKTKLQYSYWEKLITKGAHDD